MTRSEKDLGDELEKFEEEVENLKNTKMKIFGITMTPTTIGALFALLSAIGGSLYGAFEVYKDYMDMKEIIANIDTDAIEARNNIIETKLDEAIGYSRDIKNGLKDDILKLEGNIERLEDKVDKSEERIKSTKAEIEGTLQTLRNENNALQKSVTESIREVEKTIRESEKDTREQMKTLDTDLNTAMKALEREMNEKIQEALNNPLSK